MNRIMAGCPNHHSPSTAELRLTLLIHEFFMEKGFVPYRGFVQCLAAEIAQAIPDLQGESASATSLVRRF